MLEGKFDGEGVIWFKEKKRKPFDARKLQSAMFMDRPDLWTKPRHNHRRKVAKEQLRLLVEQEDLKNE